jgi:hypothetical protein
VRTPSWAPEVTRVTSVALAVAAVALLAVTALADHPGGGRPVTGPAATSARPSGPAPVPTLPGSIEEPSTAPARPKVAASKARAWLRALAGKWAQDPATDYFQFRPDGTGEWVAYGQRLWTGTATPRDATTFDLSDPSGQGTSYWRVTLVGGGRKLVFAGTRQTYPKA